MRLSPASLSQRLAAPLAPLYVLFGDEPLTLMESADAIRAAARAQGFEARSLLVVTPTFRWSELFLASESLSLFGGKTFVDLRIPSGKPGREGAEALQRYAQALPAQTTTLISLPEIDWRTQKSAWFSALEKAGVVIECKQPAPAELPAWIRKRLAQQGQSAPPAALEFIAARVEGNLLAAHQEIQKLGLLYPARMLTLAEVEAAVLDVARFDIDDLKAAVADRQPARAARVLAGLRAVEAPPPLILWVLAQEARLRKDRAALLQAAKIDRIVKGVGEGDLWDEFLQLCLHLTRA
ncbi:MAG: DNA polymerase III subunit delta [Rhodocyclaceae bacterium]|nr:DNA polymerase III subunit delta [Rhodocyclaceae bacterium]